MSIDNGSFEDGDLAIGSASGWALSSLATLEAWASFGAPQFGAGQVAGFEAFEWFDVLESFDDVESESFSDDFETGWANTVYLTDLIEAVRLSAQFDSTPQEFEDFEEEWANDDYANDWTEVTSSAASFDVGVPQDFEDFEEEWANDNYANDWTGVSASAALFDAGANSFEDFEGVWDQMVTI